MKEEERQNILEEAKRYNTRLVGNTQIVGDTFDAGKETTEEYDRLLRMDESGMMGYIIIPKINVELPIYHTTKEEVLTGHLSVYTKKGQIFMNCTLVNDVTPTLSKLKSWYGTININQ